MYETYVKIISIEAQTMIHMASKRIFQLSSGHTTIWLDLSGLSVHLPRGGRQRAEGAAGEDQPSAVKKAQKPFLIWRRICRRSTG